MKDKIIESIKARAEQGMGASCHEVLTLFEYIENLEGLLELEGKPLTFFVHEDKERWFNNFLGKVDHEVVLKEDAPQGFNYTVIFHKKEKEEKIECPKCGSDAIVSGDITFLQDEIADIQYWCDSCRGGWTRRYKFVKNLF